ncbi:MAG: SgcJ/EcaC family oxidoreductase [Verrucomicrobiales bacterium]|nr:SgcJ/EcaC family oxidoreductase [Verrucomicrobiales bacterium]
MKFLLPIAALCALLSAVPNCLAADAKPSNAPGTPADEIRQTAKAFVEAFHKGDAAALANFWTPDGDYTDLGGRVIKGRDAIRQDYEHLFAENKGLTLRIEVGSIRFPTPDTAIEDGVTSVMAPTASAPNRARYSNLLVKRDGKWLLSSVRESDYLPPNHQEHLRPLEWMIGEWMDTATNGHTAHVVFEWSPDRNYILSVRVVEVEGTFLDNGTQRIAWDPSKKQIRSWSFEPDGGFGESTWTPDGNKSWIVKSVSTLQSGHPVTATTQVTRVNPDTITFQVRDQKVDGHPIPDSAVVTMQRVN